MDAIVKVLLIEDTPGDAYLARQMLAAGKFEQFEIDQADRLARGLEVLAGGGVDVVLLDLDLPDSRGLETFEKVEAAAADIPIIVLTGLNDTEIAIRAVHQGAQDFLFKDGMNGDQLTRAIRYAIERKKLIAELRKSLREVKALRGMLPICSACKKIRDDQGYWQQLEVYLRDHADVVVSHGMCPECVSKFYTEPLQKLKSPRESPADPRTE